MNINKEIAENLRAARKAAGLTQAELATELGKSQRAISSWEAQERNMPLSIAVRASMVLKKQIIPLPDIN